MEKPKMPKFYGGVRKYAIFRADFKHAVESRYSKRDAITFLRSCLQGKPLELIKGIGSDYTQHGSIWTRYTVTEDSSRTQSCKIF